MLYFVIPSAMYECSKLKNKSLKNKSYNNTLFLIAINMCLLLNSQIILEALLKKDMKGRTNKPIQTHNVKITPSPNDHASAPNYY